MYKIAILGCENSHANNFLKFIYKDKIITDVEVIGVYSDERESAEKLQAEFGVEVADSYDAYVGKVDGIIVTARNGKNHLKYAQPYIASGIPMFIDKPITNSEEDAVELMRAMKASGVRFSGGSSVALSPTVSELRSVAMTESKGKVLSGHVRAPLSMNNAYGGFYFYSQHLIETTLEIFGFYPLSVQAFVKGKVVTAIVRYESYDVVMEFTEGSWKYYAFVSSDGGVSGGEIDISTGGVDELKIYHGLLLGGEAQKGYREFIAPVFVMNAIKRSIESGNEEAVNPVPEI